MNLMAVAISPVDGGFIISCQGNAFVRTTWEDTVICMKQCIDNPPQCKSTTNDLFGYKSSKSDQECPDWVKKLLEDIRKEEGQ
jgi:hypothetical protein